MKGRGINGVHIAGLVFWFISCMLLNQLKIAPAIVQITYIALLGSVASGTKARAFGPDEAWLVAIRLLLRG
jgi:hypothetical protein